MPSTVDVNIKWSDFSKNVSESWMRREDNSAFCDISLVSEDGQNINAHKIILANSSSVFRSILLDSKYPIPLIYLRGVNFDELVSVLDFIYKGETNIPKTQLKQFLHLAEELKIKGLNEEVAINNASKEIFNADSKTVEINSQMFNVIGDTDKGSEHVKPEIAEDITESDLINKRASELLTPEIVEDTTETSTINNTDSELVELDMIEDTSESHSIKKYPVNTMKKLMEDRLYTCNLAQSELDDQVLSMIEKQPWKEEAKQKNGKKRKNYKCRVCNLLSRGKLDSVKHVETHINGLRYTCTVCKHITKNKATMKEHIAQHKPDYQGSDMLNKFETYNLESAQSGYELEPFSCSMDENEVKDQALTMVEKQEEKGSHGNLYKCNVCNLVSRSLLDCLKHVERHIDELSYSCLLCNHITKTKARIKVHILRHEGNGRIRNLIDITSLASMDKDTLEEQIALRIGNCVKHVNGNQQVKEWTCTVCGKVSMRRNNIISHVENYHIEGLLYSCSHSDCSYSSKTRNAIGAHLSAAH